MQYISSPVIVALAVVVVVLMALWTCGREVVVVKKELEHLFVCLWLMVVTNHFPISQF